MESLVVASRRASRRRAGVWTSGTLTIANSIVPGNVLDTKGTFKSSETT